MKMNNVFTKYNNTYNVNLCYLIRVNVFEDLYFTPNYRYE